MIKSWGLLIALVNRVVVIGVWIDGEIRSSQVKHVVNISLCSSLGHPLSRLPVSEAKPL